MTSAVNFQRDAQGQNTYAPNIDGTPWKYAVTLAANTEQHFTIPRATSFGWLLSITPTPGGEVWFAFTPPNESPVTATTPSGSISATSSVMNPGARTMPGETYVSMKTTQTGVSVSIEGWYPPSVGAI
jgi:hypothetical protein